MAGPARFQLVVPDEALAPDVLGLWDTVPAARSFAPGAGQAESLCWRVDLPANRQAAVALDRQGAQLFQERRMLTQQILPRFASAAYAAGQPANFALGMPQPERELMAWLQMIGRGQSFSPWENLLKTWRETARQGRAFIAQLQCSLAHYAWVETSVEGEFLGRTIVDWLGNVTTEWRAGLGADRSRLHQRTVTLAVESRTTWMQVFLLAAQGVVMVPAVLSVPGGALLALPAALKFIRQVLVEFSRRWKTY